MQNPPPRQQTSAELRMQNELLAFLKIVVKIDVTKKKINPESIMIVVYVKSRKVNNIKCTSKRELTDHEKQKVLEEAEELQKFSTQDKIHQTLKERKDICKRIQDEKLRLKVLRAPLVIELPRINIKFIVESDSDKKQANEE